jgi:GAF domain-containing protein
VFNAVRHEVASMFNLPRTVLMRYDPDEMATLLATDGEWLGPIGRRWPLKGDDSSVARVRRTGRAARIEYVGSMQGTIVEVALTGGVRHAVGVPIVVEGDLWGVMSVASDDPAPLPVDLERRLEEFTELLGTAIANAESRAELAASEARARELANEQAALRRVATRVAQGAGPDELFSAVAEEVAGIIDLPVVGVHRYEADGTLTILSIAGETSFTVGSRWPVEDEGVAGMILATGRPARRDDYSTMPGPLGDAVQEDLRTSMVGVPIVVEGSIWGFVVAATSAGSPIPPDTRSGWLGSPSSSRLLSRMRRRVATC